MTEQDLTPIKSYPDLPSNEAEISSSEAISIASPTEGDFAPIDSLISPPPPADQILTRSDLAPDPDPGVPAPPETSAMDSIRNFSDQVETGKPIVPASYPFSLLIEGRLTEHEKDKLMETLSREQFDIREIDLELQMNTDRILIPRISEYAGILLVQALRDSAAHFRFGPAETIFKAEHAGSDPAPPSIPANSSVDWDETPHPADTIPIISNPTLLPNEWSVIDTITASATLKTQMVEAERSPEFERLSEALKRELKFKAFRLQAKAIYGVQLRLTPLASPTHYRIFIEGTAIRASAPATKTSEPYDPLD